MAEKEVHRLTDCNDGGGCIDSIPQSFVFVDDLLVSIDGSKGTGHPPCPIPVIHCYHVWETANGPDWVVINDIPVNHQGNADTCGHLRDSGAPYVFINT